MGVGLDAFGCLDEALDLILGKAGFLDVAKQIHDFRLVMKVVDNLRVRGRGQTEQHVGIGGQHLGQLFDYLWPWRTLLATLYAAQVGGGDAYLGRRLAQAEVLGDSKVADGFTKVFHRVKYTLLFSVLQHKTILAIFGEILLILVDFTQRQVSYPRSGTVLDGPQPCRRGDMSNEEVLKLKEVAALLKVGDKTVYSMAQTGELPAFKVRGQWRFSRKDIDAWIEQQKHTTQDFGEDDQK